MQAIQAGSRLQAAPAALWRPSRAAAVAPLCAKKKGFSNEAAAQGLKVNSRGKVSSRPGPPPRKQQQQQQPPPQQAADEPPAVAAAAPSAVAPPAPAAPAAALARAPQPSAAAAPAAAEAVSTPQAVVDRMAKRVAAFAIAPVLGGVAALGAFWYLKVVAKVEYPLWVAYLGSTLMFGGGLAGITYGILSTSWDPRREGSFWGWTEVRANIAVLMDKGKQGR